MASKTRSTTTTKRRPAKKTATGAGAPKAGANGESRKSNGEAKLAEKDKEIKRGDSKLIFVRGGLLRHKKGFVVTVDGKGAVNGINYELKLKD